MYWYATIDSWVRIDDPDMDYPSVYPAERRTADGGWEGRAYRRLGVRGADAYEAMNHAMARYRDEMVRGADEPIEVSITLELQA